MRSSASAVYSILSLSFVLHSIISQSTLHLLYGDCLVFFAGFQVGPKLMVNWISYMINSCSMGQNSKKKRKKKRGYMHLLIKNRSKPASSQLHMCCVIYPILVLLKKMEYLPAYFYLLFLCLLDHLSAGNCVFSARSMNSSFYTMNLIVVKALRCSWSWSLLLRHLYIDIVRLPCQNYGCRTKCASVSWSLGEEIADDPS